MKKRDIYKIVGENILLFRKKQGYSLQQIAKKAKISFSFLGNIEKGTRKPTLYTIEKIAKALNCSLLTLLSHKSNIKSLPKDSHTTLEIIKIINKKTPKEKERILKIIKLL